MSMAINIIIIIIINIIMCNVCINVLLLMTMCVYV